jgi:NAD(P)-dependent dehydrogenase (short-subunit alcohol dehydrogenase family)
MVVRGNEKQAEGPRVVLVTGASSGIGLACASYLAERGFVVYGTSRRAGKPVETPCIGEKLRCAPSDVTMLPMDVTRDESVQEGIECILSRHGRLDIVVNNA